MVLHCPGLQELSKISVVTEAVAIGYSNTGLSTAKVMVIRYTYCCINKTLQLISVTILCIRFYDLGVLFLQT